MSVTVEDPRIVEFDVRTDEMLVNMGPQHPSTHGVLRLLLRRDVDPSEILCLTFTKAGAAEMATQLQWELALSGRRVVQAEARKLATTPGLEEELVQEVQHVTAVQVDGLVSKPRQTAQDSDDCEERGGRGGG